MRSSRGSVGWNFPSDIAPALLGLLIKCPELAELRALAFDEAAQASCRLSLSAEGELRWTDQRDDDPKPESKEPGTTIISHAVIHLLSKFLSEPALEQPMSVRLLPKGNHAPSIPSCQTDKNDV